jgi:eukaryotic-like serine/threonine-protein kinase
VSVPQRSGATYDLPRGTVLGKYEILRKLATGGMAEIYLARTRGAAGFEKLVVLKRILPNVAEDPAFVNMFLDEARLAATLQHPNIADVYDVGETDGTYFFTMEHIHGEDARTMRMMARKRNESIPMSVAIGIVHGIAQALDYAHNKMGPQGPLGLVHRDVSSSNILVSYDGAVKLVDFGIARATANDTKTRTGTLKGKIPYMSPEQCRNQPLDRRSDLFSLGTVLFELTVGRRPFRGQSDFEIMQKIVHGDAPAPRSIQPDYPLPLDSIVTHLLARDVADRYQSAEEVIEDLEAFSSACGLFVSPKQIARYMRTSFALKIAGWEAAEETGISLGQYVADNITSESKKAELVTPPSAFDAVSPPELDTGEVVAMPLQMASSAPVYPVIRKSRVPLFILAAAGALALGAGIGIVVLKKNPELAVTPAKAEVAPEPAKAEPPKPTVEPAVVDEPATPVEKEPVVEAKPAPEEPPKPVAEPAKPVAEPAHPVVEPAKPTKPAKVVPKQKTVAAKAKPPEKTTPPVEKPPEKPPEPKKPETKEPTTWDPNSPFLPPSK